MNNNAILENVVLVLNRFFQPVHIISAKEAMKLLISDKVQVVDTQYNCYNTKEWANYSSHHSKNLIRTPFSQFLVPEIVRLLEFDKKCKHTISLNRENILIRDEYRCQYCGRFLTRKTATIDHVVPKSRQLDFGLTTREIGSWNNVVACCYKCNSTKGDKTPKEAKMKLRCDPKQPTWVNHVRGLHYKNIKPTWKVYLEVTKG